MNKCLTFSWKNFLGSVYVLFSCPFETWNLWQSRSARSWTEKFLSQRNEKKKNWEETDTKMTRKFHFLVIYIHTHIFTTLSSIIYSHHTGHCWSAVFTHANVLSASFHWRPGFLSVWWNLLIFVKGSGSYHDSTLIMSLSKLFFKVLIKRNCNIIFPKHE